MAVTGAQRKTQAYCDFCIQETFYRPFRKVRGSFSKAGFQVTPVAAKHPALGRLNVIPGAVVELPVRLFQTVEIVVQKPQALAA